MPLLFENAVPTNFLWVSETASEGGDGSQGHPFRTIQSAVNNATAGTAIMVTEGTYVENVKLPTKNGGTESAPIWLLSADGPQKAQIVAAVNTTSAVYGYGTDNFVISGFSITGGKNGIQFSQSGSDFSNLTRNIVIENNVISGSVDDGIKVSQGRNIQVVGNVTTNTGEEGIDFVAVNNGLVQGNEISGARGAAGIFAKGGSTGVVIDSNYVHDIPIADGILIGGWTESKFFVPGYDRYEAKNITVTNNLVEDVGRRPLNILGGVDSVVTKNYFEANANYYTGIGVASGSPLASAVAQSYNDRIFDNIITNKNKISIATGSHDIFFYDNSSTGIWSTLTGPDAYAALHENSIASSILEALIQIPAEVAVIKTLEVSVSTVLDDLMANMALTGSADVNAVGNALDNVLTGNAGNNLLDGMGGKDTMGGGLGDDTYIVDNVGDVVVEGADSGRDTVKASISYTLGANVEKLMLTGCDNINASGNDQDNTLVGNAGDNVLDGKGGADIMSGGAGNDIYIIDHVGDVIKENSNSGTDTVLGALSNITLATNVENFIYTGHGNVTAIGNSGANILMGGSGNDYLDGKDGNDTLIGGDGNDVYVVNTAADRVVEYVGEGQDTIRSSVSYTLSANVENLVLFNGTAVTAVGNSLDNVITGNAVNNVIDGGAGADVLSGGKGNDAFVFHFGQANGDTITDFAGRGAGEGDQLVFYGFGQGQIIQISGTSDYLITPDDFHGGAAAAEIIHLNGVFNLDTQVGAGHNDVLFY